MIQNKIFTAALSVFKPKPVLTISEWADQYRYIARGTGPEPGRWKTSRAPYTREMMDMFNTAANLVVVMASSQVGKTEIALNMMAFYMAEDPSAIMYLMPTEGMASDFSKTRVDPTIKASEALIGLFKQNAKKTDNTIELKTFPSGYLALYGASTPTKLASKPIRVLIADEVDRYPKDLPGEGSPVKLALQRTTNFWNRKVLIISTPTAKETSVIVEWFEKSDKRYFNLPCPSCYGLLVFKWELVKWENDENGDFVYESAFIECPHCEFHIRDVHKEDMLLNGQWIKTAPEKDIPGFHISSLYSPWVSFSDLVKEYIEIANSDDQSKMREFLNLKLGEPYEEITEDLDIELLEDHKIEYGAEIPEGVLYLTCGVDVQANRLEYQILGWGEGNQTWVIIFKMIIGDPEQSEVWDGLDIVLNRSYSFADGRKLRISATCVDSGYLPDRVYKFTTPRERMRVAAIKGYGGEGIPIINNPTGRNRTHTKVMKIGVDAAKGVIYSRLRNHHPGNNYIRFPRDVNHGCGDEYYRQLTSERRILEIGKGSKRFVWRQIRDRNEALDTFVYALAAYEMAAPNLELVKEQLALQILKDEILDEEVEENGLVSAGIKLY